MAKIKIMRLKDINEMKLNNEEGLTLVEVLVSISIFFVLSALVYTIFFSSVNNSKKVVDHNELRSELITIAEQFNDFLDNADRFEVADSSNGEATLINVYDVQAAEPKTVEKKDGDLFLNNQKVNSDFTTAEKTELLINDVNGNLEINFIIKFKDSIRQTIELSLYNIYDVEDDSNEQTE